MLESFTAVLKFLAPLLVVMALSNCATTDPAAPREAAPPPERAVEEPVVTAEPEPAPEAVPAAPPSPAEARDLIRRAAAHVSYGIAVRVDQDNYLGAVADVDGNGQLDIGLLLLGEDYDEQADLRLLSDTTRLYHEDARTPELYLAVLSARNGGFSERHRFNLGRRRVVSDVAVHPLRLDRASPAAFVVSVTTRDGSEQYWNTFSGDGIPTTLLVDNTGTTRTVLADIDGNHRLDFIRYQTVFEQGRGYDTLISWTRWSSAGFEAVETTNVVRNLRSFLDWAAESLSHGAWQQFVDRALLPATLSELAHAGLAPVQMIDRLLIPENGNRWSGLVARQRIEEVIFPEIMRNPFRDIGIRTSFRTSLRVITAHGDRFFFLAEIGMQQNPFQPQQFFFEPIASQGE